MRAALYLSCVDTVIPSVKKINYFHKGALVCVLLVLLGIAAAARDDREEGSE